MRIQASLLRRIDRWQEIQLSARPQGSESQGWERVSPAGRHRPWHHVVFDIICTCGETCSFQEANLELNGVRLQQRLSRIYICEDYIHGGVHELPPPSVSNDKLHLRRGQEETVGWISLWFMEQLWEGKIVFLKLIIHLLYHVDTGVVSPAWCRPVSKRSDRDLKQEAEQHLICVLLFSWRF